MLKKLTGPLIAFFLIIAICAAIYALRPVFEKREQLATSDLAAAKGKITLGLDGYAGYFFLQSPEMKESLLSRGYRLIVEDDQGSYAERMQKLAHGTLDMAVFTIDTFIANGAAQGFPASIVAVISESRGSDAIVGRKSKFPDLDSLKQKSEVKVALTLNSPSEYLLKTTANHFGISQFLERQNTWAVSVNGSSEALKNLEAGTVDVAVLWEPEISKAIGQQDYVKLLGTEQTEALIVDVLVVSRDFIQKHPESVTVFLENYFTTLKRYRTESDRLIHEFAQLSELPLDLVESMLGGIEWKSLQQNVRDWFGHDVGSARGRFGLFNSIETTLKILQSYKSGLASPFPNNDPRTIMYDAFVTSVAQQLVSSEKPDRDSIDSLTRDFHALSDYAWSHLASVGTLKQRPISFRSGSAELTTEDQIQIDQIVDTLKTYPNFRLRISGHTSPRGDPEANRALSSQRAQTVADYIVDYFQVDPNRIQTVGMGGEKPLPRKSDEPYREYLGRIPRVEVQFLMDEI